MDNVFAPAFSLSKPYTFWADPGHGWLQVPAVEILALGIKPSAYSYRSGGYVYLEEDCDLGLFMRAKGVDLADGPAWFAANVTDRYVDSKDLPFPRR